MDKKAIEKRLTEILNDRFSKAEESMKRMTQLRNIYALLRQQGQEKGAKAFRDHVFMMLCEDPMMEERQIMMGLIKDLDIKI